MTPDINCREKKKKKKKTVPRFCQPPNFTFTDQDCINYPDDVLFLKFFFKRKYDTIIIFLQRRNFTTKTEFSLKENN